MTAAAAAAVSENDDGDLAARRTNFGFLTYAECNVGRGSAAAAEAAEILASSEFDPLLSPHVYVNGVDAGRPPPSSSSSSSGVAAPATTTTPRRRKVGILLIDHGSKRSASNEHIHAVARMYERTLKEREDVVGGGGAGATTVVRAAHMEISAPSILDALRDVLVADGVAEVVCVPYFLSPGRHATEDVPNLIAEGGDALGGRACFQGRGRRMRALADDAR
ncbi:hypothetical protein ACHAW5_001804 [Stephanodiscus triporus]|uniref:Sirohydrochlorin cobaltochelatase n=1 Tax=Stephanodiscus triporus TaxID=2934178 RepID=A0ABD3QIE8_9STRA